MIPMGTMAYIARCKCGNLIFASVDDPTHTKENAKDVARFIKDGYSIERIPCSEVRTSDWCMNRGNCK